MDGVSIAASILGIATAGVQVSIKLATLATQISTASDRVSAIGNDISLTSNVLRQLGDLMTENLTDGGISILNQNGLESTKTAAAMCEKIFSEIEKEVKRGSEQLRRYKPGLGKMRGQKIELSTTEKAKWPFLQPRIDSLRADLRDAKSTLILLLQVATLALNKWMADTSMSSNEHQDVIRAIVALELDRREERANVTAQQEVSRSPSSNDAPDIGTPATYDPGTTTSRTDFPGKRKRDSLDATASTVAGRQKSPRPPGIMEVPQETFPGRHMAISAITNPPLSSLSSGIPLPGIMEVPQETSPGRNSAVNANTDPTLSSFLSGIPNSSELKLFLLKPIVRDLFDRIELRWTVQDTSMRPQAIRDYMNTDERNGVPSVVEMLQQLHAYEQEMVDAQMPKDSEMSILSLRRTTIDIRSRDILFKAVPGLQFVVQCHARQSLQQQQQQLQQQQQQHRHLDSADRNPASTSTSTSYQGLLSATATLHSAQSVEEPPSPVMARKPRAMRHALTPFGSAKSGGAAYLAPMTPDGYTMKKKQPSTLDQDEDSLDEEAEAEAEAMVNGLLKQYTTLYDS